MGGGGEGGREVSWNLAGLVRSLRTTMIQKWDCVDVWMCAFQGSITLKCTTETEGEGGE